MLNVIIGILVIIVIIYLAVVIYQRRSLKQVTAMEGELNRLRKSPVVHALHHGQQLGLTGPAAQQVQQEMARYEQLSKKQFPKIKQELARTQRATRGLNILQTRDDLELVRGDLEQAAHELDEIQATVTQIEAVHEKHRQAVSDLEQRYQKLRKELLTKNAAFGPAIDALEGKLSQLETAFSDFSQLARDGEQEEAEPKLNKLETETSELEELVKQLPALYQLNHDQFPKQLAEISDTYQQMKQAGFAFVDDDFLATIQSLRQLIAENNENIKHVDLEVIKDQDDELENAINSLYDRLSVELDAKKIVDQKSPVLTDFIAHAQNQNQLLVAELDKLSHNYTLEHGEQAAAQKFAQQLQAISDQHQQDLQAIAEKQAIYSQISNRLEQAQQELTQIEKQQIAVNDSIADLSQEERDAQLALDHLTNDLHGIHRRIENYNLPGIPDDYIDYFTMVSDELQQLEQTMKQAKLSMDDVGKQLQQIRKDRDSLQEKTDDLLDQARLAEQVMQYANRYATSQPDIAEALKQAKHLFEINYRYRDSLATMVSALDKVEPGAYRRLENNYYRNKPTTTNS
ncbi:septation ring formation regulator EzrA [Fructilactobacillus florum]|uniref:septation ring formation regulator EzrA n=1 Tax=Fructilactobacillus florum TaxID=640331 RepID=UPI00028E5355|nr:septation ring formation regulator EzrA [Fructilactobacillus florum]EKK20890.1 Septation ring formation regulator EzrA [Fructilactobacillus florum 2F]